MDSKSATRAYTGALFLACSTLLALALAGCSGAATGPQFLSFGTDVASLEPGQSVSFVAVLTDTSGLSSLAGGSLQSPDGAIQYGAFVAANQGSYQLDLSWAEINQTQPIDFSGGGARQFTAVFFDQQGRSASRGVSLGLNCPTASAPDACGGICGSLQDDRDNCGSCGNACPSSLACAQGQCTCPGSGAQCDGGCVDLETDPDNCGSCGNACGDASASCSGGSCACTSPESYCADQHACRDLATDMNNCGGCGQVCNGIACNSGCQLLGSSCPSNGVGLSPCGPGAECMHYAAYSGTGTWPGFCSVTCTSDADCSQAPRAGNATFYCIAIDDGAPSQCEPGCGSGGRCADPNATCLVAPDVDGSNANVCD